VPEDVERHKLPPISKRGGERGGELPSIGDQMYIY
jgi:hypothetical protein